MTTSAEVLLDAFGRIRDEVEAVLDGISQDSLVWRADPSCNTIAWLIWHLTRVQDDHFAGAFDRQQVWHEEGWETRFGLPFPSDAHGYGQSPEEVGQVQSSAELLRGYQESVYRRTVELLGGLGDSDLDRVVDERWDPPVTLAVRIVSVIADELQHVGQAAIIRGIAERTGH